ncbi:Ppx/GppA family phosphatase [Campylobacter sp. faydin G-140]|uniref:Ppx/GppA phosphatase family protein n=1 Tax=Campylobacter anatolicus TaxID=2829105 RepID=UPI001B918CF5|nr:Ppx/GppA phosphatase family protein [Campylobacter anatolicus]MBR8465076.1 Ppx/GppA family phosphatase [Campylobacter anatolicus]
MAKRTAVIDIGSNSMRMAIFERTSRWAFFILGEYKMRVRLGEGGYGNNNAISEKSMRKAYDALSEFKSIIKNYKCNKILCVGTSALRDAPNSGEFIKMIQKRLNIGLRVIDGKAEATYGAIAAKNLLAPIDECVTVDIGGGSTELARISNGKITHTLSLDIGTVRLKELFFDNKNTKNLSLFLKETIAQIPNEFKCDNIIAIGGSLRAMSSAIMTKDSYTLDTLHGFLYRLNEQKSFLESIANANVLDLNKFPIKKDRYDTIREGVHIFLSISATLGASKVFTSGVGVREGVFLSDFLRPSLKFPQNFNPSVKSLQDRFTLTINKTIVRYAKEIFISLKNLHNLDDNYLNELLIAARLYNVGQEIGFYGDHKNSAYIILNGLNFGFTHEQKALIATIIATNGKKVIYEYDRYKNLLPSQECIRWLSFILALAKALNLNCADTKLKFEFINHTLQIYGARNLIMARKEIKKMPKPEIFAISFV